MLALLLESSAALARNDADALEQMCAQAPALAGAVVAEERATTLERLSAFRREVLAARSNIVLRERLLAARGADAWAR